LVLWSWCFSLFISGSEEKNGFEWLAKPPINLMRAFKPFKGLKNGIFFGN
jgi:hypothetical protein